MLSLAITSMSKMTRKGLTGIFFERKIRINKLLRNKKFNFIGLSINLMKPWEKENPNNQQSAMLIEFYNLVVDTPLFKS